jgi:hypothetical protein
MGFLVGNKALAHLFPKVIVTLDPPGEANLVKEVDALFRELAFYLEGSLILDPSAEFDIICITLRDVAVAIGHLELDKLSITSTP